VWTSEGGRGARKVIAQGHYFVVRDENTSRYRLRRAGILYVYICTQTNSLLTGYYLDDRCCFIRRSKGFCLATESILVLRRTKSCPGGYPKVQLQAREAGKSPTRKTKDSIR
jgi:hypothetical protein